MPRFLRKMKIGPKLITAFLTVTLLSSIAGTMGIMLLKQSDTDYSDALNYYGFSQGDIGLLTSGLRAITTDMMQIIATDDRTLMREAEEDFIAQQAIIEEYSNAVAATNTTDEERASFQIIVEQLPEFFDAAEKVLALAKQFKNVEAMALYQEDCAVHMGQVLDAADELMRLNRTTGTALSVTLTETSGFAILMMLVLMLVAFSVSVVISILVARSIARPMGACSQRLVQLSEGDLKTPVPTVDTQDETGVLAQATATIVSRLSTIIGEMTDALGSMASGHFDLDFNHTFPGDFAPLQASTAQIIAALNDALKQIRDSAEQVTSGSGQVSMGAQALSQGATEQASSVQELAATINEISTQINSNAQDAVQARDSANEVGATMQLSNEQMSELNTAMSKIEKSSDEIGKIIKTIEDIAFQTNILALNAAVEAARAGAAGKGFAVVADEVRNLASKSAEASKNTSALIENSIHAVQDGTRIAGTTSQSLQKAVEGTSGVVAAIDRISNASAEQASSIAQITQGVDQISIVVQTNSATAEESAAASEELSGQAEMMRQLVGRFVLRDTAQHVTPLQQNAPAHAHAAHDADSKY